MKPNFLKENFTSRQNGMSLFNRQNSMLSIDRQNGMSSVDIMIDKRSNEQ